MAENFKNKILLIIVTYIISEIFIFGVAIPKWCTDPNFPETHILEGYCITGYNLGEIIFVIIFAPVYSFIYVLGLLAIIISHLLNGLSTFKWW